MADGKKISVPPESETVRLIGPQPMASGGEHTSAQVSANNPRSASSQAPGLEGTPQLQPSTGDLSLTKDLTHDSITNQDNCVPPISALLCISNMTPGDVSSDQNPAATVRSNTTDPSQVGAAMASSQEHGARPKVQATKPASSMPGNVRSNQNPAATVRSSTTDPSQVEAAMAASQEHDSLNTFDGRRQTFSDREKFADDLCEAGFYLTVKCHHCGFELARHELNMPEFDAWTTHARHSKGCQFVIKAKGKKFVDEVNKSRAKKDFASTRENLYINNDFDPIDSKSIPGGTTAGPVKNTTGADGSVPVNGPSDNNQPDGAESPRSLTANPPDQHRNTSGEVRLDETWKEILHLRKEVASLKQQNEELKREQNTKHDKHEQHLSSHDGQFSGFCVKQEAAEVKMQDIGRKVENNHNSNRQNTRRVKSLEDRTSSLEGRADRQEGWTSASGEMTKIFGERVDIVQREQQELNNRVDELTPNLAAATGNDPESADAADPAIVPADENEDAEPVQETDV